MPVFDTIALSDAVRLWCAIGTLDLLRNVGRIVELLNLGPEGWTSAISMSASTRFMRPCCASPSGLASSAAVR
jgi:hypothetical protein